MKAPWPKVRLGDVLKPVAREETVDATKEYRLLGIRLDGQGPFLRQEITGAQSAAPKLFQVRTGDFIYSRLFASRGAFGLIEREFDGCYVSGEFPTFIPVADRIDLRFLRYWFQLPVTLAHVNENCSGSTPLTRNRFKENFFLALEIPLPPLEEQRQVVARVEELAGKIQEARVFRKQAVEEAEALLSSRAGDVFARLAKIYPRREFGSFRPHVTSGPRNWAKHYEEGGYRFYRAQDIGPTGQVLQDSKVFISPPPGEQGRSAMLGRGDLMLVITGATVGRVATYREGMEPGFVSQHVAICRLPSEEVRPEFALWGLRSPDGQAQLIGQRYGQGKPGLNLLNIRAVCIPLPPITEQQRIVANLDALQVEVDVLKHLQAETVAELDALQPAVLDRAFKGEL